MFNSKIDDRYFVPNELNIKCVDCKDSFEGLSDRMKKYAECFYKASWGGMKIVAKQISKESPLLLDLIHSMFSNFDFDKLKEYNPLSDEDKKDFLNYWAYVCGNLGNYSSKGDNKFVPRLSRDKMDECMKDMFPNSLKMYETVADDIYSLEEKDKILGFPPENKSGYFSNNLTKDEVTKVDRFMIKNGFEGWNTRLFKIVKDDDCLYIISVASSDVNPEKHVNKIYDFEDIKITVTVQDYCDELKDLVKHLEKCMNYVANDTQKKMLECYVKHFKFGDINDHKDSQRYWIKDMSPDVETNIGFIENYRDPDGIRSEFEGFVSVVNKEETKQFSDLVSHASEHIKKLPWDDMFEKDKFIKPDFTSLDVLGFCASGIPIGINIPNYDDVRMNDGFKNVNLGNIIKTKSTEEKPQFIPDKYVDMYRDNCIKALTIQVATHELLGHGSGKLFMQYNDGSFNVDEHFLKKNNYGYYKYGETWGSKFGRLASSYEECRAECIALYYATYRDVAKSFDVYDKFDYAMKTSWLQMIATSIKDCTSYNIGKKQWMQAHAQARFVIYKVLKHDNFVDIKIVNKNGEQSLEVEMDLDNIETKGKKIIGDFLNKLQIYKATADVENGTKLYNYYSEVTDEDLKMFNVYKQIMKPYSILVQPTLKNGEYKNYTADNIGMIRSIVNKMN